MLSPDKLEAFKSTIVDRPPYRAGVLDVDPQNLVLFYGKTKDARRLDFGTVTEEELKHLTAICDPATYGMNHQDVYDETYRKAGKLDAKYFSSHLNLESTGLLDIIQDDLLEGGKSKDRIRAEIYKLNVYGEGSFFKAHKDTPRDSKMFGSLVIVFQTPHEGGSLIIRDKGQEWTFDSAQAVAIHSSPCIGYIAFYSDVEHEVTPVTNGHRVTLTYNLYFKADTADHGQLNDDANRMKNGFEALLRDPAFLPKGGYVGFGLNREYPIPQGHTGDLGFLMVNLKGSDAAIMRTCKDLNLTSSLQVVLEDEDYADHTIRVMCDNVPNMDDFYSEGSFYRFLRNECGGKTLDSGYLRNELDESDEEGYNDRGYHHPRPDINVIWVTELSKYTMIRTSYIAYGNEASLAYTYAEVCLIVQVGPYGKRENAGGAKGNQV